MAKPPASAPPLLTIPEVADRLNVSVKTVRRAIKAGELHSHRVGSLHRIAEDDLALYIAQRRR